MQSGYVLRFVVRLSEYNDFGLLLVTASRLRWMPKAPLWIAAAGFFKDRMPFHHQMDSVGSGQLSLAAPKT